MAQITWSIVGLNISEAERAAAVTAGALSPAVQALQAPTNPGPIGAADQTGGSVTQIPPARLLPPLDGVAVQQDAAMGLPIGTTKQMADQGYLFTNGKWTYVGKDAAYAALAATTSSTVTSASTISPGSTLGSSGPRPDNARLIETFVGGSLDRIRVSTGVGAGDDGALTPIRNGFQQLPRIIIDNVFT